MKLLIEDAPPKTPITMAAARDVSSYQREDLSSPETISKQECPHKNFLMTGASASGFVLDCLFAA